MDSVGGTPGSVAGVGVVRSDLSKSPWLWASASQLELLITQIVLNVLLISLDFIVFSYILSVIATILTSWRQSITHLLLTEILLLDGIILRF